MIIEMYCIKCLKKVEFAPDNRSPISLQMLMHKIKHWTDDLQGLCRDCWSLKGDG